MREKKADLGSSLASQEFWSTDRCHVSRQHGRLWTDLLIGTSVSALYRVDHDMVISRTLTCCNPSRSDFRYSESNKPGHVLICIVSCIPRGCNLVNMVWSPESLQTKRLSREARGGWSGGGSEVGFIGLSHYECFH
jgi:hypothetical protein